MGSWISQFLVGKVGGSIPGAGQDLTLINRKNRFSSGIGAEQFLFEIQTEENKDATRFYTRWGNEKDTFFKYHEMKPKCHTKVLLVLCHFTLSQLFLLTPFFKLRFRRARNFLKSHKNRPTVAPAFLN